MSRSFRSILFFLFALLVLGSSCRPDLGAGPGAGCEDDTSCTDASTPYCDEGVCVECASTNDCGCHDACVDGTCEPLGASDGADLLNAHGTWSGTPGNDDYTYNGTCEVDSDCGFGQRCNPLTAGCVVAADFVTDCGNGQDCPPGPHGELLVCEPSTNLCLPAAACETTNNCCGMDNFRCDETAAMCRPIASECTPPDTISSDCPFEPRLTDECEPGTFCGPMGECVACVCDGDCSVGQKCYASTMSCKALDYCENNGECASGQTCDEDSRTCVAFCDATNESEVCDEGYYCDLAENLCAPLSDRPCTPDEFAPNQSADTASSLTLPTTGNTLSLTDLTLCDSSDDWFQFDMQAGKELTVTMSSVSNITGVFEVLAADGSTSLAEGALGALGGELLRFTANRDDTYFLRITRTGSETGFYSLTFAVSQGELCEDSWESVVTNDTIQTPSALFTTESTLSDGCARGSVGGNQVVICEANVLTLCDGDVDYYSLQVEGGSRVDVELSDYSGDLDLALFGPFASVEDATSDGLLAEDNSNGPTKTVVGTAREDSLFIARVLRDQGERTGYAINVVVDTPPSACVEDAYDATQLNDTFSSASAVSLNDSGTTHIDLNVCIADIEWLELTLDGTNPVPAGYRVSAQLAQTVGSPNALTLALLSGENAVISGSTDIETPATQASLGLTDGQVLYAKVTADPNNPSHETTQLVFELEAPPACTSSAHFAPASAIAASPTQWSSTGDSNVVHVDESLCGQEDDWYSVAVPAGLQVVATVDYDPRDVGVALSLYNPSVAAVSDATFGQPLASGMLSSAEVAGRSFQSAWAAPESGNEIYIRVQNTGGWPVANYALTLALAPTVCSADNLEPNNTVDAAATLVPVSVEYGDNLQELNQTYLSSCGGDADWYQTRLLPGDTVEAAVYFDASEANLSLTMFGQEDTSAAAATGSETSSGRVSFSYNVDADAGAGLYPIQVQSLSGDARYYGLEVKVQRACTDDNLEPVPPALAASIDVPFDQADLVLCADEDWYTLSLPAGSYTICTLFEHDDGDIDLSLYETGPTQTPVASSMTKNDVEVISFTSTETSNYELNVFLDDRDSVITNYRLVIGSGIDCSAL